MTEAVARFGVEHAACAHRIGDLAIGDLAVWVGVSARHRHEAFLACRYIIDEVKHRVPIWKKEHYQNGDSGWVNCERCAAVADARAPHEHRTAAPGHCHQHPHDEEAHAQRIVPDYSRQMALKEIGAQGQARLRSSRVLVVGCGGLGVPVLTYLAGAGVGRLGLVDADRLEPSNLHRQTLYALADVGKPKAELGAARLRALNPDVDAQPHVLRLDARNASELVAQYDLVIDCTDNFSSKFLLNDVCMRLGKPLILSSVYQYEGQLQIVRPAPAGTCLRCVWPEATRDGLVGNCAEAGVLGPVPGVFGSLQALEAMKLLLDLPGQLGNELLMMDLTTLSISRMTITRAPDCRGRNCVRTANTAALDAGSVELDFESLEHAVTQGYELIDIREARECEAQPAPASRIRHIPMAELLHGKPELSGSSRRLLVCASGKRSLAAAQELRARGLDRVFSLRGGIAALTRSVI
jgi:adenylyltransferase/sulfurtransferase